MSARTPGSLTGTAVSPGTATLGKTVNYVPNGGFENTVAGWNGVGASSVTVASLSRDATVALAPVGTSSLKVVTTAGNQGAVQVPSGIRATPGQRWTASAYMKGGSAAGTLFGISVVERQADGTANNASALTFTSHAADAAQRVSISRTVSNPSTVQMTMQVYQLTVDALTWWVDGCQLELGSSASTYADTNGLFLSAASTGPLTLVGR
jgi:carbohydrate binding protein with CBM4/9 domain